MDENYQHTLKAVEDLAMRLLARVQNLEQQVANQAIQIHALTPGKDPVATPLRLKKQAAQQQTVESLYAPLRSDTKPLLEMSAFVRKIADFEYWANSVHINHVQLVSLVGEAKEILKRST